MNPIMSSETVRLVHDSMIRDQLARQRQVRTPNILRHGMAVLLVALGDRLDPSVRRSSNRPAPAPRLGAA
jgi:hypothetical protein